MSGQKQRRLGRLIIIFAIMPAVIIIGTGCKKRPAGPAQTEHSGPEPAVSEPVAEPAVSEPVAETTSEPRPSESGRGEPAKIDTQLSARTTLSLNDIIRNARTWRPAYTNWYGTPAPDFTLADLAGKEHKLSDYRGKNVLLVFWATWCGPCEVEVPHLIELQNQADKENLVILGLSYVSTYPPNTEEMIKRFAAAKKINYPVFAIAEKIMPGPYNAINAIPSSFFIDPEGKIKLATSGLISLGEIKAILQAP